jgi:cyclophilin family peptidyl-prolyl cis-trans isomerase
VEHPVAEREGFEPSIRFWRILTFQASAFDHSATAPRALDRVAALACGGGLRKRCGRGITSDMVDRFAVLVGAVLAGVSSGAGVQAQVAQGAAAAAAASPAPLTPAQVVAGAPAAQWVAIAPEDLLVMELAPPEPAPVAPASSVAPSTAGAVSAEMPAPAASAPPAPPPPPAPRRVVIQLIAPPYSQGWVANIRVLAAEHWWDGLAIVRAQDNYVVQWGDPQGADPALARPLPGVLQRMPAQDYVAGKPGGCGRYAEICPAPSLAYFTSKDIRDAYAASAGFVAGWPVAVEGARSWPVHCYGSVGVGRDVAPDTGSGAELYAVIGQAPRQLDRNIAVVGRVIEGIEHLASLPRGTGELGFYATPQERTAILSVRPGDEVADLPRYEYLSSSSESFARYVHARANRQDSFYVQPAGAVDVCNVPVPVRRVAVPEKPMRAKKRGR